MTTQPASLGAVAYASESSFCEAVDTVGTRLLNLNPVSEMAGGLTWDMIRINPTLQRQNEGDVHRRGMKGGNFTLRAELGGHGSTTAGALTATDLITLLGLVLGNVRTADVGATTMQAAGSNTTIHLDTESVTLAVGSLFRTGVKNDGRADGQWSRCSGFTDNGADEDVELDVALPAAPNQTDAVFAAMMAFPDLDAAVTSLRFLLSTANYQYICRGCFCTGLSITGASPNETPMVELTFEVSHWDYLDPTYPSVDTTDAKVSNPCSQGSFHIQDEGTTTRNVEVIREFEVNITMNQVGIPGTGGVFNHQRFIAAKRLSTDVEVRFKIQAEASTTSPTWADWFGADEASISPKLALYGLNLVDGKSLALCFPKLVPIDPVPTIVEMDGLNWVDVNAQAQNDDNGTTDLDRANIVLAVA